MKRVSDCKNKTKEESNQNSVTIKLCDTVLSKVKMGTEALFGNEAFTKKLVYEVFVDKEKGKKN